MTTQEDIERQWTLLQTHRKTLWVYLVLLAQVGIANAMGNWVKIRTDIVSSRIAIWVNDNLHISQEDRSFGGPGFTCLHTFFVVAQFRNLHIYKIVQRS